MAASLDVKGFAARGVTHNEVMLSLIASDETQDEWIAARARHHAWGSRARPGFADGSQDALDICRSLTLVCEQECCGALVHWMAALRQARAAQRAAFTPGDGCSSRMCSKNHRPGAFRSAQRSMAAGLKSRKRYLIEWPSGPNARAVLVLSASDAAEVAASIAPNCARANNRKRCTARTEA